MNIFNLTKILTCQYLWYATVSRIVANRKNDRKLFDMVTIQYCTVHYGDSLLNKFVICFHSRKQQYRTHAKTKTSYFMYCKLRIHIRDPLHKSPERRTFSGAENFYMYQSGELTGVAGVTGVRMKVLRNRVETAFKSGRSHRSARVVLRKAHLRWKRNFVRLKILINLFSEMSNTKNFVHMIHWN